MSTLIVTLLAGWFLSAFGWMALAAIAATVLAYAFMGKKGAAVTAVLAVAVMVGWRSFARNGWAASRENGRPLTAKERMAAQKNAQRKQWKSWNKGADVRVNQAAAQFAMQTDAMAGAGGGMALSMPYVQVPNILPLTGTAAHIGPLFGGTPGQVTLGASQSSPAAAASSPAAPPASGAPPPAPAASTAGGTGTGATASPAATAAAGAADAKANAASTGSKDASPSAASPQKGNADGKPAGSAADRASAAEKSKRPAADSAGSTHGSQRRKAASPKASESGDKAQNAPTPAKQREVLISLPRVDRPRRETWPGTIRLRRRASKTPRVVRTLWAAIAVRAAIRRMPRRSSTTIRAPSNISMRFCAARSGIP